MLKDGNRGFCQRRLCQEHMRAAWLENGQLSVRDVPLPELAPDWALVRVTLAGIRGTELELARGYKDGFAGVPGHCRERRVLGMAGHAGAFAEYLTLPVANLTDRRFIFVPFVSSW